jgi:hypothetical protein
MWRHPSLHRDSKLLGRSLVSLNVGLTQILCPTPLTKYPAIVADGVM